MNLPNLIRVRSHRFLTPPRAFYSRSMSYNDSIAKLPTPLRDLVASAIKHHSVNTEEKVEVSQWIDKVAAGEVGKAKGLKVSPVRPSNESYKLYYVQDLDSQLTPRTFVVDNVLTPADIAIYGALHPTVVSK
jgi:aminoacyl tRNA synthase complex-interacting multifunctional protein 1